MSTMEKPLSATEKTPDSSPAPSLSTSEAPETPKTASTHPKAPATPAPAMDRFPDLDDAAAAEPSTKTTSIKSTSTSSANPFASDATFTCATCCTPDIPAASVAHVRCMHKYCFPCLETLLDPDKDLMFTLPMCSTCNPFLQSLLNSRQEDRDEIGRVRFLKDVHEAKAAIAREGHEQFLRGVEARRDELLREMQEEVDVVWRGLREVEAAEQMEKEKAELQGSAELRAVGLDGKYGEGDDEVTESSEEGYLDVRIRELIDSGSDTDEDEDQTAYTGAIADIKERGELITAYQLDNIVEEEEGKEQSQSRENLNATIANLLSAQHLHVPSNTANSRISVATALSVPMSELSVPESSYNPFEFENVPSRVPTEASLLAHIQFPMPPITGTNTYHKIDTSEQHRRDDTAPSTTLEACHSRRNEDVSTQEQCGPAPPELAGTPPRKEFPFPLQSLAGHITPTLRDRRWQKYAEAQSQQCIPTPYASFPKTPSTLNKSADSTAPPLTYKDTLVETPTTAESKQLYTETGKRPKLERVNTGTDYSRAWRPPIYEDRRRRIGSSLPETPAISDSFL